RRPAAGLALVRRHPGPSCGRTGPQAASRSMGRCHQERGSADQSIRRTTVPFEQEISRIFDMTPTVTLYVDYRSPFYTPSRMTRFPLVLFNLRPIIFWYSADLYQASAESRDGNSIITVRGCCH